MASHSSGIPVSNALKAAFGEAQTGAVRYLKVEIVNDEMVETARGAGSTDWEADLDLVPTLLEDKTPCYVLFKKISEGGSTTWVLFAYVPDTAKVKPKMLYASSRAPLKLQLGSGNFEDDVYGTVREEFSRAGYAQFVGSKKADAPLTDTERAKQEELEHGEIHVPSGSTYVHGVAFPVDDDAVAAVKVMATGGAKNYVCLAVDTKGERITLDHADAVADIAALKKKIHQKEPRFHFFAWAHQHAGTDVTTNVFIFSCPDGSAGTKSAPVRQRMLYSSSKANVSNILEQTASGVIGGKVEVNSPNELTEEGVRIACHPPDAVAAKGFAKPKRQVRTGSAGGRRLIRGDPS